MEAKAMIWVRACFVDILGPCIAAYASKLYARVYLSYWLIPAGRRFWGADQLTLGRHKHLFTPGKYDG
jgi:hypothetical protein